MEPIIQIKNVTKTFIGKDNQVEALKGILWWICLPQSTSTPFNQLFRQLAALSRLRLHVTPKGSTGILS